ncbi:MAG: rhomboid family intramembrane serine protease [Chromatiales bacterium]|jgi:rhomboid protease GluP
MTETEFREAPVSFQTFVGDRDPARLGKGKATIAGTSLVLSGRKRSFLAFRKEQEIIRIDDIYNVIVNRRVVRFNVRQQNYKKPRLLLFRNEATAQAFAARLPQHRTAEAEQAIQDAARFQQFLQTGRKPFVTYGIIATCVLAYIATALAGNSWVDIRINSLIQYGGNYAPATATGEWWRLLTAVFLHGGLIHIGVNMAVLWDSGRILEKLIGHGRYLLLYLTAGVAGSLASINWQQDAVSVGASGAIFGVYGALTVGLMTHKGLLPKSITQRLRTNGIIFIVYVLAYGATKPGIDNAAHLGGLLAGCLIGAFMLAPVTRLALAYASLIVAVGYSSERAALMAQPYQDEMAYQTFFQHFKREENRLDNKLPQLAALIEANKKQQALALLENEIIDGWRKLDAGIMQLDRIAPDSQKTRNLLATIIHLKREGMELISQAIRKDDDSLIEAANAKITQIHQLIENHTREAEQRKNSNRK